MEEIKEWQGYRITELGTTDRRGKSLRFFFLILFLFLKEPHTETSNNKSVLCVNESENSHSQQYSSDPGKGWGENKKESKPLTLTSKTRSSLLLESVTQTCAETSSPYWQTNV